VEIELEGVEPLRLADDSPVRAASAVAPLGDGYLVVQDDATHGVWFREGSGSAVRLLPAVEGLEVFDEASGTKHLKPDLEAACQVIVDDRAALLVMGSGSSPHRMRWSLLTLDGVTPQHEAVDMTPLYGAVAEALSVDPDALNLEGACVLDRTLRWFHRGLPSAGWPSGSVDLDLDEALGAVLGRTPPGSVRPTGPHHYDLGDADGVGLAVTDAVLLPGGKILLSAAAEDSPNARDDGPVVGSALVLLRDRTVEVRAPLPLVHGEVPKVEGLMVLEAGDHSARLLAVIDDDDTQTPSLALRLHVRW
jgi:hypothetical protein